MASPKRHMKDSPQINSIKERKKFEYQGSDFRTKKKKTKHVSGLCRHCALCSCH